MGAVGIQGLLSVIGLQPFIMVSRYKEYYMEIEISFFYPKEYMHLMHL